jgi:putative oxidoreductase
MQEKIAILSGFLLGLIFVVFGLNFFFHFLPVPSPEEGSVAATFMGAAYSSGLLSTVKILEIIGGICVALPRSRNLGLLILGPIVVNILLYQILLVGGSLLAPPVLLVILLSAYLLWVERAAFAKLAVKK